MRKTNGKTKNTKNTKNNRYRQKSKSMRRMRRTRKGGSAQSNYYNDDPNSHFPVKNNANQRYQILTLKKLLLYIEDKQLVTQTDDLQTLNDRLNIAIQNLEQLQKLDKSEKFTDDSLNRANDSIQDVWRIGNNYVDFKFTRFERTY
jgi:hypothetical protein